MVQRHRTIRVAFSTAEGEERSETYDGYLARVIQHEIDHLTGHVFLDRMDSMESLTTVGNWLRFHRAPRPRRE